MIRLPVRYPIRTPTRQLLSWMTPEVAAYVAAMDEMPSDARIAVLETLVSDLKAEPTLWAKLDIVYLLATHSAQAARINLKRPGQYTLRIDGTAPTFTADTETKGSGAGRLIAQSYNTTTAGLGLNFTLNNAAIGIYVNTAASFDGSTLRVDLLAGTSRLQRHSTSSGFVQTAINQAAPESTAVAGHTGHFMVQRTGASARELFRNGASLASSTTASTTASTNFSIFGSASFYSDAGLSLAYAGASLTSDERAALETAITNYLTSLGVI